MAYTTNAISTTQFANPVADITSRLKSLSATDQLALLWFAYTQMGKSITPAAPGAARLQFAEGLINGFKEMSYDEQMQAMRDLANKVDSPVSRAYGILGTNTKLAFWYVLAEMMVEGTVIPVPTYYRMSEPALRLLDAIGRLEFGQQITVLRNAVADMGFDPLA
ncbi:orange carotenoid protein N-terminal domain-containing protein [Spirulina sp. CS-785/01]|uniref:orange carotenoid protein N-terminal domain-containing protein n=1 Tax=Spirulina sp. CS-785/01 TaxID=3021716 RepID=UPI00232B0757|nr:orange carotenoid protein N-terminal domain-containing protein [Spirulina sp. CS-785/01]MDB9314714.1 orange carotenoid protein N-terminal domain-containing protein [Spirulina sp. CS-785/01]